MVTAREKEKEVKKAAKKEKAPAPKVLDEDEELTEWTSYELKEEKKSKTEPKLSVKKREKKLKPKKEKKKQKTVKKEAGKKITKAAKKAPKDEKLTEWTSYDVEKPKKPKIKQDAKKSYKHGDYILYKKEVETSGNKKRTVHFFSKKKPDVGKATSLPNDYEVKINKRTKVPYLRKKT